MSDRLRTGSLAVAERILDRCDRLGTITSMPGMIERVHLSPEHREANDLAAGWIAEAGLEAWQDAAGNQCGRLEGAVDGLPALLLGSHLDTVRDAGRYDGMLGVLLAIEVAARIAARDEPLPFALEVVGFSDEEGTRFGSALAGSRALAGHFSHDWWEYRGADGLTYADASIDFGLDPGRIGAAARRPEALVGYLEAHIEQGPYLEDADRALAVVPTIAGARRFALTMTGVAGHAGGTPYARRRDALVGASELVAAIERIGIESGTIATVGRMQAFPGGVNVIPGRAEFSLDLRAETNEARDAAFAEIERTAAEIASRRGLAFTADERYRADATPCADWLQDAVEAGIRSTGDDDPMRIWSRAGHDGMAVQAVTDIAMLFIRCGRGGISHHPDETVARRDVALALDAMEAAVLAVADRVRAEPDRLVTPAPPEPHGVGHHA
ncbi:allantoate amidohydrolase [Agromyces sp. SYSU T00194]|uniref:allantoate amidohydrolase n=1 Tax=Agromyces chitinivorans TaxID=3158560 RepID=UPI00339B9680